MGKPIRRSIEPDPNQQKDSELRNRRESVQIQGQCRNIARQTKRLASGRGPRAR